MLYQETSYRWILDVPMYSSGAIGIAPLYKKDQELAFSDLVRLRSAGLYALAVLKVELV